MRAVFDSNILIDFLNGDERARQEVRRYTEEAISIVTWIEVLAGATPDTESQCRILLSVFKLIDITPAIAERAVALRKQRRLKVPDAIIGATAQVDGSLLITRDTDAFSISDPGVLVPYQL